MCGMTIFAIEEGIVDSMTFIYAHKSVNKPPSENNNEWCLRPRFCTVSYAGPGTIWAKYEMILL